MKTENETSQNGSVSRFGTTFRALKHKNFQLFFAGQFVSLTGTWMQSVAQSWLVYRLTGSVVLLGLIGFASQIPVFLLAPIGGLAADRMTAGVPASKASFQPPTFTAEVNTIKD